MSILSNEKINEIFDLDPNMGLGDWKGYKRAALVMATRAIEAAVLETQSGQEPVWIHPSHLQNARNAPFLCKIEPNQRAGFVPLYTAPVVQPDRRRLYNDITEAVAKQLHYFDNVEKINGMTTAKEVSDALEGGIDKYRNDALFHAKVCSFVAQLTQVIAAAEGRK